MRALFNPIVRNNSGTITATNAVINYSPQNIKHPSIKKRVQGAGNNMIITIPFDDDQCAKCFFYGRHNLSALSVVYRDSLGNILDTIVPATINDIGVEYFSLIENIRSIELTITTAYTYVRLGGFDSGVYYQMPNFLNAWPIDTIDNSLTDVSLGGQMTTDDIPKRRAYKFRHIEIIKATADELITNYNLNGKQPIFIDLTEGNRNFLAPIYARIEKPFIPTKADRRFSFETELQEAF